MFSIDPKQLHRSVIVSRSLLQKTIDETPLHWRTHCEPISRCLGGWRGSARTSFGSVNSPDLTTILFKTTVGSLVNFGNSCIATFRSCSNSALLRRIRGSGSD